MSSVSPSAGATSAWPASESRATRTAEGVSAAAGPPRAPSHGELLLENIALLAGGPAAFEARYGLRLGPGTFRRPGATEHAQAVLHFLLVVIGAPEAAASFAHCYPVLDRAQERDFRKLVDARLLTLERLRVIPLGSTRKSIIQAAGGDRFVALVSALSTAALKELAQRHPAYALTHSLVTPIRNEYNSSSASYAKQLRMRIAAERAVFARTTQTGKGSSERWMHEADALKARIQAYHSQAEHLRNLLDHAASTAQAPSPLEKSTSSSTTDDLGNENSSKFIGVGNTLATTDTNGSHVPLEESRLMGIYEPGYTGPCQISDVERPPDADNYGGRSERRFIKHVIEYEDATADMRSQADAVLDTAMSAEPFDRDISVISASHRDEPLDIIQVIALASHELQLATAVLEGRLPVSSLSSPSSSLRNSENVNVVEQLAQNTRDVAKGLTQASVTSEATSSSAVGGDYGNVSAESSRQILHASCASSSSADHAPSHAQDVVAIPSSDMSGKSLRIGQQLGPPTDLNDFEFDIDVDIHLEADIDDDESDLNPISLDSETQRTDCKREASVAKPIVDMTIGLSPNTVSSVADASRQRHRAIQDSSKQLSGSASELARTAAESSWDIVRSVSTGEEKDLAPVVGSRAEHLEALASEGTPNVSSSPQTFIISSDDKISRCNEESVANPRSEFSDDAATPCEDPPDNNTYGSGNTSNMLSKIAFFGTLDIVRGALSRQSSDSMPVSNSNHIMSPSTEAGLNSPVAISESSLQSGAVTSTADSFLSDIEKNRLRTNDRCEEVSSNALSRGTFSLMDGQYQPSPMSDSHDCWSKEHPTPSGPATASSQLKAKSNRLVSALSSSSDRSVSRRPKTVRFAQVPASSSYQKSSNAETVVSELGEGVALKLAAGQGVGQISGSTEGDSDRLTSGPYAFATNVDISAKETTRTDEKEHTRPEALGPLLRNSNSGSYLGRSTSDMSPNDETSATETGESARNRRLPRRNTPRRLARLLVPRSSTPTVDTSERSSQPATTASSGLHVPDDAVAVEPPRSLEADNVRLTFGSEIDFEEVTETNMPPTSAPTSRPVGTEKVSHRATKGSHSCLPAVASLSASGRLVSLTGRSASTGGLPGGSSRGSEGRSSFETDVSIERAATSPPERPSFVPGFKKRLFETPDSEARTTSMSPRLKSSPDLVTGTGSTQSISSRTTRSKSDMMKDSRVVTFSSPFNRSSNKTSMVLLSSGDASDEERSFTSGTPGVVGTSHNDSTSLSSAHLLAPSSSRIVPTIGMPSTSHARTGTPNGGQQSNAAPQSSQTPSGHRSTPRNRIQMFRDRLRRLG